MDMPFGNLILAGIVFPACGLLLGGLILIGTVML